MWYKSSACENRQSLYDYLNLLNLILNFILNERGIFYHEKVF